MDWSPSQLVTSLPVSSVQWSVFCCLDHVLCGRRDKLLWQTGRTRVSRVQVDTRELLLLLLQNTVHSLRHFYIPKYFVNLNLVPYLQLSSNQGNMSLSIKKKKKSHRTKETDKRRYTWLNTFRLDEVDMDHGGRELSTVRELSAVNSVLDLKFHALLSPKTKFLLSFSFFTLFTLRVCIHLFILLWVVTIRTIYFHIHTDTRSDDLSKGTKVLTVH